MDGRAAGAHLTLEDRPDTRGRIARIFLSRNRELIAER